MKTIILGHMNPDADSILSAIALEDLLTKRGIDCQAFAQGSPAKDAQWVLDKFGFSAPEIISSVANRDVFLVDTTIVAQMPADIKQANIVGIVDHHKLGEITSSGPIEAWIRPVGCCGTIIKEMYDYYNIKIPEKIAGLLLSAILNDTVIFKSPTTTDLDTKACQKLAKIAKISDIESYGKEMFIIKSDVNSPADKLLFRDYKEYEINGKKTGIGQLELIDLNTIESKKNSLIAEMKKIKAEKKLDAVILMLTDIMKEGTELLVVADDVEFVEKALETKITDNKSTWLQGVLSRKKQIIPPLMG
ncbi:MAG: manganese-dependent inorganic pyrophosphatase [Alphaproteobacteria bacterium]